MTKVLVTGGCGYIGSHVVGELLNQNYDVIVVDNLSSGKQTNINYNDAEFYFCDVKSRSFEQIVYVTRPDYIIHLAIEYSSCKDPRDMSEKECNANILGAVNVFETAHKYGVKKVLFASSEAVYGNGYKQSANTTSELNTDTHFGLYKVQSELYLKFLASKYGIDFTILRYSHVDLTHMNVIVSSTIAPLHNNSGQTLNKEPWGRVPCSKYQNQNSYFDQ